MKKTLSILLALVLAFSLASCGGEKKDEKKDASVVVTGLCEAVKTFDKERIKVLLANGDISLIDQKSALLPEEFLATMKTWAENIEYEIELLDGRIDSIPIEKILDRMGMPNNYIDIIEL